MTKAKKHRPLAPNDFERVRADIERHEGVKDRQLAGWISDSIRVAEAVASGDTDLIPVFWIRTYGLFVDVKEILEEKTSATGPAATALSALIACRDSLNEDELIYLGYRRHVECHPLQRGYRLLTKGGLRESITHRAADTETTVESADEAIRRILRKYGAEHRIAQEFAARLLPRMQAFRAYSLAWCGVSGGTG